MANDLKRVGVVFTEQGSTNFVKSLKLVNAELKENYQSFKLTQAQWDKSTTTTQKLKDKLEYLNRAYDIQKDKVTTLKTQLTELEKAENKDEVAIQKKKAALAQAETSLQRYRNQINDTTNKLKTGSEAIKEYGDKVKNTGEKIEKAGKNFSAFSMASIAALTASAKSAIEFESAFAGVEKTVDATDGQLEVLKTQIRQMAKEIPSTTTEIAKVAEVAGQLGIKTEDIMSFTRVMIDLGNSTNLSATEAATALAKFANITKMSASNYSNLGSVITALGNNFATTEADIVSMATRLAATGELTGLSEAQIMALATAMSSVGIEAEAGGSAMSKLLKQIQVATETGSDKLNDFAKVAGMTTQEFKEAFEKDAVKALTAFITGLNDTERNGKSAINILSDMGLTEVRLSNTVLALASSGELLSSAVDLANKSWEENNALSNEANKRYETLKSKLTIALNKIKDIGITLGNKLMPSIEKVVKQIEKWTDSFSKLDEEQVNTILKIGLVIAAIGPLLTILGKLTSTLGGAIKSIGTFTQSIGVMKGSVTTASTSVTGMANVLSGLTNPIGVAIGLFATASAAIYAYDQKVMDGAKSVLKEREAINEQIKAREELIEIQNKQLSSNLLEIDNSQKLWDALKEITDENGKIKEVYRTRADFITKELSEALGIEIKMNNNVIDKYQELQSEVDKTILKKKAEYYLQAEEEQWKEALDTRKAGQEKLNELQTEYNKELEKSTYNGKDFWKVWEAQGAKQKVQQLGQAIGEQKELLSTANQDIIQYEQDRELLMTNTTESLQELIGRREQAYGLETASLESNISTQSNLLINKFNADKQRYNEELDALSNYLVSSTTTIESLTPEQVEKWKSLSDESYAKYFEAVSKMPPDLAQKIQEMTGVTVQKTPELVGETERMAQQVLDKIEKNPEFKQEAMNNLQGMLNGLEDGQLRQLLNNAGVEDADKVIQGIRKGDLAENEGMKILNSLKSGLSNSRWQNSLFSVARGIASTLSGLLTVKAKVNGNIFKLPGHKFGLDYVPKDNYVARLHKGERVLTKEENKDYTEAEKRNKKRTYSSNTKRKEQVIYSKDFDYERLFKVFLRALNSCKIKLDREGFIKFIDDRLLEVM